jgi:hypothetical protein
MSKDQIKYEINQVLDHFPDTVLEELLAFLKQLEQSSGQGVNQEHLHKILTEDNALLSRLAQ